MTIFPVRMDMEMILIDKRGNERVRKIASFSKDKGEDTYRLMFFRHPADVKDTAFMTWDYDVSTNPQPPEDIKKANGRKIKLIGFMYPLQQGKSIQYFCLLRTTQTCCYGPRPQYNQYVFVEMKTPTSFHRLDPVSCTGKLRVEPTPDEGFIYRMEGETCSVVYKKGKK